MTIRTIKRGIWLAVGLALSTIGSANALNLITNGGFETGDLTGWTLTGNTGFIGVTCPGPSSIVAEGNCSAFAGPAGSLGFVSQGFATTPGEPLYISFDVQFDGNAPSEFSVELDLGTGSQRTLLDLVNPPAGGFEAFTLSAVALLPTTTLSFNLRDDPGFIFVDAARVVPEPASLALMGIGLAGLWAGRVGRKQSRSGPRSS
jgi:hypothetical protein